MEQAGVWWAIAGGWAIDLWLGATTRAHHDVEVAVRREDQELVYSLFPSSWQLECIDPPGSGWRPWRDDEEIAPPSFQTKARGPAIEFDLFLESTEDDMWVFRRDGRVTRPLNEVRVATPLGIPVVAPEIQLLYMAKSAEPKNQHDFEVARPALTFEAADWLSRSLALNLPDHRWRAALA